MNTLNTTSNKTKAETSLPSAGPCAARIREILQSNEQATTLIICHDDPTMVRRLSAVLADERVVVLKLNQSDWNLANDDLKSGILNAINETGVKHLIFVGHSEGSPFQLATNAAEPNNDTESPPQKARTWLTGAKHVQAHTQQSREHFATEMANLLQSEKIRSAQENSGLEIDAYFYVGHSGSFLRFDANPQAFHPIGS
ncbi:MAG: hypothetical protein NXI22_21975 [bacterium]|nr:hypothetical protein [bacterium]